MADPVDDLAALRRVAREAVLAGNAYVAAEKRMDEEDLFDEDALALLEEQDDEANEAFRDAMTASVALRILARLEVAERVCEAFVAYDNAYEEDEIGTIGADLRAEEARLDVENALTAWRATQQETPDAPR